MSPLAFVYCSLALGSGASILRVRRKKIRDSHAIAGEMHPQALRDIEEYLSPCNTFDEDLEFMKRSGGFAGLHRRKRNAALLVEFLQALVQEGKVSRDSVAYIAPQAIAVRFYSYAAFPEAAFRFAIPKLPVVNARVAANLYAELEGSVRAILCDQCPGSLAVLDAVL